MKNSDFAPIFLWPIFGPQKRVNFQVPVYSPKVYLYIYTNKWINHYNQGYQKFAFFWILENWLKIDWVFNQLYAVKFDWFCDPLYMVKI